MRGRFSGLQRQVLSLHRSLLRAAREKPPDTREQIEKFVKQEFQKNAAIEKKNFQHIEYLIRRGHKQLEMLRSSDGFSVVNFK
ncbi:hypothetical protein R1flu_005827 [Riccia fluitans]|uniref:Complex 1 LYR protein domain-containing protein n=1 Tax=Riccia fluitans TaxID=41844 RepID=A0ABD1YUI1_9MARC